MHTCVYVYTYIKNKRVIYIKLNHFATHLKLTHSGSVLTRCGKI